MKKIFLVLMATLLFIWSCELFSPTPPTPSDITEVQEYRASDLADSGATDYPTSEEEIALAFNEIREDDPVLQDIVIAFSEEEEKSAFSKKALDVAKSLNDSLKTQLEEIMASIEAFPTTKELDEDISLSGEALGTYFILTKGEGTLSATAETDDDQAIDEYASNLESLSGEATLQIQIDPTPALASAGSSAIKDFRTKLNAGGSGSISTTTDESENRIPDEITLDYAESFGFGLSLNAGGKGGKIIFKEDAEFSGTIDGSELIGATEDEVYNLLMPQITITVKVYNDNDQIQFSETYDSLDEFITAFQQQPPD